MSETNKWKEQFESYLTEYVFEDASHDLNHFRRVYKIALEIAKNYDVDELVLLASAYFHDIVGFKKNDPKRSQASYYASLKAEVILKELKFPDEKIEAVKHCILAHSYSANIKPDTLEAKIIQDSDRMEAIGAIGLARVFYVSGQMNSKLFDSNDPFAENRELNDKKYAVDHFYTKLLKLEKTMQTEGGKVIAQKRTQVLRVFLENLKSELN